jgi:hypothetical protein
MKERGYNFYAYPCDVTDWESCQAASARWWRISVRWMYW